MTLKNTVQLQQQRQAMERQRFGSTRAEVMAEKGAYCHAPLKGKDDYHEGKLVIVHIAGGGRHATETGLIIPGKTHNMNNLTVMCQRHAGRDDRERALRGLGIEGNPNNPSQT